MRILLLGSGGREHALAEAISADPSVTQFTCAPGNPGMATLQLTNGAPVRQIAVDLTNNTAISDLAAEYAVDLVVVGPEAPLVAGVADAVRAKGIACFGPSRAAAALEGSKAFAKDVMFSAGVPTAGARTCSTLADVEAAFDEFGSPYVVKDDGLAAGKGVAVTTDRTEARAHAETILGAGHRLVVEEFLDGPEVSLFVVTDGVTAVPLVPAQDFKRIGDGDTGPNTGGMGAYAPLDWTPESLVDDVMASVVTPTLAEMTRRGTPFAGTLYVGLAITAKGAKVIEFNCRFGDPETQVVLALLETPLAGVLQAAAAGRLAEMPPLQWRDGSAVTVVIASEGYPVAPKYGDVISGADRDGVLHAGTVRDPSDGTLRSAGGRVLCCMGTGDSLAVARAAAYEIVDGISLPGSQHRGDIASAAIAGQVRIP
ncbi:MAG TPA: phosphoribosylamine--glycine ligase [Micromonosporaceae bacterium]